MIIEFECVAVAKNVVPPGRPVTYNCTYQAVQDSAVNRESFPGSISGTIQLAGIVSLPHGMDQRVKIDLAGVPDAAQPVAADAGGARRTFGSTREVK